MKLRELGDLPVANQWMVDTREHDLDLYTRAGQPPLHCVGQSTIGIALKPQRGPNQVGFQQIHARKSRIHRSVCPRPTAPWALQTLPARSVMLSLRGGLRGPVFNPDG